MPDSPAPQDIRKQRVVLRIPGMDAVRVRRDVEWRSDSGPESLDVYSPSDSRETSRTGAVILVAGYPDRGFQAMLGCRFKEMGQYESWGEVIAASGLTALAYTNREPADVHALLRWVRLNAAELGIDANRIGLFGCSGNGPTALSLAMSARPPIRCAALLYALTLDLPGSTVVADAAKSFGFWNACEGKSLADLPPDLPLFLARAGRDAFAGLNDSLERFAAAALARNLPVTVVNHPEGPHGFDVSDDSETSREIVRHILAFYRRYLS